jgi:hypothetical protein
MIYCSSRIESSPPNYIKTDFAAHSSTYPVVTSGAFPLDKRNQVVMLVAHHDIIFRLRMYRTIPSQLRVCLLCGVLLSTGTNLHGGLDVLGG